MNIESLYAKVISEADEWIYKNKILDEVQLKTLPVKYLDSIRFNITNSDVVERIVFLAISLYCFSTETRFL